MNDLVSIVIPVYNVEEYIHECVVSVINQTYKNLEIILVDDGSPDNCPQICDEYAMKDNRVIVVHQKNGGLSAARNSGISKASGKYICFLDSDDYIKNTAIEKLLNTAKNNNSDLVFFDANILFDEKKKKHKKIHQYFIREKKYKPDAGYKLLLKLYKENVYFPPVQFNFIKKDLIDNNKLKFLENILHEDELFTIELFINSKRAAHCHETLYTYRKREGSITTNKVNAKNFLGINTVFFAIFEMYKNEDDDSEIKNVLKTFTRRSFFSANRVYHEMDKKSQQQVYDKNKLLRITAKNENYFNNNMLRIACINYGIYKFICKVKRKIKRK